MRLHLALAAGVFLGACRSDHASGAAAGKGDPAAAAAPGAVARQLAGCYVLRTDSAPPYRLYLSPSGEASLVGAGAQPNRPGDAWEWSAKTESTFVISWSGIDSRMEFNVGRRAGKWGATGVITTAAGDTPLTPTIERVECQSPGA